MAPAATLVSASEATGSRSGAARSGAAATSGDFLQDVSTMAASIERRLKMSLSPREYAMVQDLVLATRILTIARDADDMEASHAA